MKNTLKIVNTEKTEDKKEKQKHLNLHNKINNGLAQKMALIVDKDGCRNEAIK